MSQVPNLYNHLAKQAILMGMIQENGGELTEELAKDLSLEEDKIMDTMERMLELRDSLNAFKLSSEKRIEEETAKIAEYDKTLAVINARLEEAVRQVGSVQLGSRFVAIKASTSTDVVRPEMLPVSYLRHVPAKDEQWLPDKTKILKDLRKGVFIPGAALKSTERLDVK